MNSEFEDLLSLLAKYRVKYLLVGGYAVIHYCEPRYTKDIDIFVEASKTNARKLRAALEEFAGPLPELSDEDLADPDRMIMMGRVPTRIDLLKSIDGVRFATAWKNRVRVRAGARSMNVISKRDLVRNKRASGRPQDLIDLEWLTRRS